MDLSLLHVFKQQYTNTEWHNYYKSKLTILYVRRFGMGLEIDEMVSWHPPLALGCLPVLQKFLFHLKNLQHYRTFYQTFSLLYPFQIFQSVLLLISLYTLSYLYSRYKVLGRFFISFSLKCLDWCFEVVVRS